MTDKKIDEVKKDEIAELKEQDLDAVSGGVLECSRDSADNDVSADFLKKSKLKSVM